MTSVKATKSRMPSENSAALASKGSAPSLDATSLVRPAALSGGKLSSVDSAIEGLPKVGGEKVDRYFVETFFHTSRAGELDLPPVARRDPELCQRVAGMVQLINVSLRDSAAASDFITEVFASAAKRELTPYEVQLLEFAAQGRPEIKLVCDYNSRVAANEHPTDENRVVFGKFHHLSLREKSNRVYTPEEAFSVLMHELAHARDDALGILQRDNAAIVMSEVRANIYAQRGDVSKALSETEMLYPRDFKMVKAAMPGYEKLSPMERFRYLSMITRDGMPADWAFVDAKEDLKKEFPKISDEIERRASYFDKIHNFAPPKDDDMFDDGDGLS